MGTVAVYADPPRVEYDIEATPGSPLVSLEDMAEAPTSIHQWQRQHTYGISYAIRNGGPTNLATGTRNITSAILAGGSTIYSSSATEVNQVFPGGATQPETSNLFEVPTPTYETLSRSVLILTSPSHSPPTHTLAYSAERTTKVVCLIRLDVLQDLVDAYPDGTITFLTRIIQDQSTNYDIHGQVLRKVLSTDSWTVPEVTFPLSDFGVEPTPSPVEANCIYTEDPATTCTYSEDASPTCTYSGDPATTCTYTED